MEREDALTPVHADAATGRGRGVPVALPNEIAGSVLPIFSSPRALTTVLAGGLIASALVAWLATGVHLADVRLHHVRLSGGSVDSGQVATVAGVLRVAHVLQILAFGLTGALLLGWLYRLRVNVRALGMRRFVYGRLWTLLGFLVPGLNVVRPYQVMAEIWRASDPSVLDAFEWKRVHPPRLLLLWWGSFVIAALLQLTAVGLDYSAGVVPLKVLAAGSMAALADAAAAICASIGFFVVTRLSALQIAKCNRLLGPAEPW